MKTQAFALPALALMLGLAACAKPDPFVETPDLGKLGRSKAEYKNAQICFSDGDRLSSLQKLADEECAKGQKKAVYIGYQRWQCRLTVPHLASFACVDPAEAQSVDKRKYMPSQGTGLPAVDKPDEGGDLFGTFGFGK